MLEAFLDHLINEAGRRPTSVKRTQYMLRQFLVYLADLGITEPEQMNRFHVRDFLASRLHWKRNTLHINARLITQLLRYLYLNGLYPEDLSVWVPRIPCDHAAEIPIVYSSEEVDRLLAAVDRDNPCGKRNYAILLLAARLDLRWGDIRRLRFDNLRWDEERIVLDQAKTGGPLVLPLTDEIGSAIIDYLKHGRPKSDYREIFLKSVAPIEPFGSFSGIGAAFSCYKRRAGIRDEPGRRSGMHALRHTLASRLMEQGTPMQTISDILGHAGGVESTKHYLRIDIETLRRAALDIEEEV